MKNKDLSDSHIREILAPYATHEPDEELCSGIRIYIATLLQWNAKIALTAITDVETILRIHFGESFFAANAASVTNGRAADIGTGAGFPGLPMRMLHPSIRLSLVEPIAKKTAFLSEVARKTGISDVSVHRCRMEDLPDNISAFDFITARALGEYDKLLDWSKRRLSRHGKCVLLVGEKETMALEGQRGWNWDRPQRIPQTEARFVLAGCPVRPAD